MIATIQLQVSGNNIPTYDIYQDADNYTTAVVTDVPAADLLNPYDLNLSNNSTTVRLIANGVCGTQQDIIINFNDETPAVTVLNEQSVNSTQSYSSMASDGKGNIFQIAQTGYHFSSNNGDTWISGSSPFSPNPNPNYVIWNNNEFQILDSSGQRAKYFESNGSWLINPLPNVSPIQDTIFGYFFHNNIYYIKTTKEIFRSEDGDNYVSVLTFPNPVDVTYANTPMDAYGDIICVASSGNGVYKSTDNGLNWQLITSNATGAYNRAINMYVEDENKYLVQIGDEPDSTKWQYTINGGDIWSDSWLPTVNFSNAGTFYSGSTSIIKVPPMYYYNENTFFAYGPQDLKYTSYSPFAPNASGGTVYTLANSPIANNDIMSEGFGKYNGTSLLYSKGRIIYCRPTTTYTNHQTILVASITNT